MLVWSKESFSFYHFFMLMNHWPDILHWKWSSEIFILVPNLNKYENFKIPFSFINNSQIGWKWDEMNKTQNHHMTFRYLSGKNQINGSFNFPMPNFCPIKVLKIRPRPYLGLHIWNNQTVKTFVRLDEPITFLVILSHSNIVLTKKDGFVFGRDLQVLMAVRSSQCVRIYSKVRRVDIVKILTQFSSNAMAAFFPPI